jgi:hypothetical protein
VPRVYVVWRQKSRMGNEKSPSRDPAFERCTENYTGELPLPRVLLERTTPESPDGARAERSRPPAVLFASTQQQPELSRFWPNSLSKLCSLDQPNHSFQAYAVSIEEMNSRSEGLLLWLLGKKQWNDPMINHPIPKLRKAPQPPLSRPGATPDSDRAKRPPLSHPSTTDAELTPGDRVEGLGTFGKPTGELGTVERANEEDAVVKWDDDGRTRLRQPSLKKV